MAAGIALSAADEFFILKKTYTIFVLRKDRGVLLQDERGG
jgi:hypothetical protein